MSEEKQELDHCEEFGHHCGRCDERKIKSSDELQVQVAAVKKERDEHKKDSAAWQLIYMDRQETVTRLRDAATGLLGLAILWSAPEKYWDSHERAVVEAMKAVLKEKP